MKKVVVNFFVDKFKKNNYQNIDVIKYGLESLYILITKTIVIFGLAFILDIFYEVLIFSCFYGMIRMTSFGLHATKSWVCYLSSTIIFVLIPYLLKLYDINIIDRTLLGIFCILVIYLYSPSDTHKRPIKKNRNNYKFISVIIAISMVMSSLLISNIFIHNALIISLFVECIMILPITYSIFNLPYNNYKKFG